MSGFAQLLTPPNRALVQRHAAICAALVLVMGIAYLALDWHRDQSRVERQQNEAALANAQAELSIFQESRVELDRNLSRFQTLEASGFIGSGDRIAWAEALLNLQRTLDLPELSFELAPQRALSETPVDPALEGGTEATGPVYGRFAHDMRIRSKGMHERELLRLIEGLRAQKVGFFRVNQCRLTRVSDQLGLEVDCLLRWITYLPTPRAGEADVLAEETAP